MPVPLSKHVAKRTPVLFHEDEEAPHGTVEGVQQELSKRGQLGRPVPTITAVHNYRIPRSDLGRHEHRRAEYHGQVVDPIGFRDRAEVGFAQLLAGLT